MGYGTGSGGIRVKSASSGGGGGGGGAATSPWTTVKGRLVPAPLHEMANGASPTSLGVSKPGTAQYSRTLVAADFPTTEGTGVDALDWDEFWWVGVFLKSNGVTNDTVTIEVEVNSVSQGTWTNSPSSANTFTSHCFTPGDDPQVGDTIEVFVWSSGATAVLHGVCSTVGVKNLGKSTSGLAFNAHGLDSDATTGVLPVGDYNGTIDVDAGASRYYTKDGNYNSNIPDYKWQVSSPTKGIFTPYYGDVDTDQSADYSDTFRYWGPAVPKYLAFYYLDYDDLTVTEVTSASFTYQQSDYDEDDLSASPVVPDADGAWTLAKTWTAATADFPTCSDGNVTFDIGMELHVAGDVPASGYTPTLTYALVKNGELILESNITSINASYNWYLSIEMVDIRDGDEFKFYISNDGTGTADLNWIGLRYIPIRLMNGGPYFILDQSVTETDPGSPATTHYSGGSWSVSSSTYDSHSIFHNTLGLTTEAKYVYADPVFGSLSPDFDIETSPTTLATVTDGDHSSTTTLYTNDKLSNLSLKFAAVDAFFEAP